MNTKLLTLVICTYNRTKFLKSLLIYYSQSQYIDKIDLLITDGSDDTWQPQIVSIIEQSGLKNIRYFHYPGTTVHEAIHNILDKLETDYVVYNPDDDFHIINNLMERVLNRKEFSGIRGITVGIRAKSLTSIYNIPIVKELYLKKISDNNDEILTQICMHNDPPYSIMKKEIFKKCFIKAHDLDRNMLTEECLFRAKSDIMLRNIPVENFISTIRIMHEANVYDINHYSDSTGSYLIDSILSCNSNLHMVQYIKEVSSVLVEAIDLVPKTAQRIAKKSVAQYLRTSVSSNYFKIQKAAILAMIKAKVFFIYLKEIRNILKIRKLVWKM